MLDQKLHNRKFITQLIEKKIEPFEMPIQVNAQLRDYQKEGVAWLAFLNKYGSHGILSDGLYSCFKNKIK